MWEIGVCVCDPVATRCQGPGSNGCYWIVNFSRKLLWHGSRLTNWVGILGRGLRIAPPEAPVTGYMVRASWRECTHLF